MNVEASTIHLRHMLWGLLLLLSLSACATSPLAAQPPQPNPTPHSAEMRIHAPVILRVVEREAVEEGTRYLYKDIYFRDSSGDATILANDVVAMNPEGGIFLNLSDDVITTPASQQKQEGLISARYGCPNNHVDPFDFTVEDRVRDEAGNLSAPVRFNVSCPADVLPNPLPSTIAGIVLGLALLLAFGLYLRARPTGRQPLLLSIVSLLSALMTASFLQMTLHEAGHALMDLPYLLGKGLILYVHPFTFNGYARPVFAWTNTLGHAAGAIVGMLGALLISLPFWPRRSLPLLALVFLFPWALLSNGGYIASASGDFHNIMQLTDLPPILFNTVGAVIAVLGLLMLFTLLPLCGLAPGDRKVLLVIPAVMFVWGMLSKIVAVLWVPGSPFARRWHLTGEILLSTNDYVGLVVLGLLAAVLYITLYRWLYPRLPAWLRLEPAAPTWKGTLSPALMAVASLLIGLSAVIF